MLELLKRNYWWPELREDVKKIFRVASSANRTKFNTNGRLENYTHWKYPKDCGRKSA